MRPEPELRRALAQLPLIPIPGPFHRVCKLAHRLGTLRRRGSLGTLDAIGSRLEGGRFNFKGRFEVLYLAEDALTAQLEADTILLGSGLTQSRHATPTVHVGVDGRVVKVLDLTDEKTMRALRTSFEELRAPWRLMQAARQEAPTQVLGRVAWQSRRVEALRYCSAKNFPKGRCIAIFPDRLTRPSELSVTDDSGQLRSERLPKRRARRT